MIYLNNATTSFPKPPGVIDAVSKCIGSVPLHSKRSSIHIKNGDIQELCRKNISTLFNVRNPNDIIFTSGATESLNLAIFGLDLHDKHVITTFSEHNSVIRPLKTLQQNGIISLSFAPSDQFGVVDLKELKKLIRNNTALIAVNHCSNVTGNFNDISAISSICKSKNILFLVDASQSAGIIQIDLQNTSIDLMAFTGHKSLFGIRGIGGLYIKDNLELKPLKVGGTGTKSNILIQPSERPIYYESGTPNIPGIAALNAGISFLLETGQDVIIKKEQKMMEYLLDKIFRIPNIILFGNYQESIRSPIVSFNINHVAPAEVGYILENMFGIIVRSGLHCAPLIHQPLGSFPHGTVRISLSYFTNEKEIDQLILALNQTTEKF